MARPIERSLTHQLNALFDSRQNDHVLQDHAPRVYTIPLSANLVAKHRLMVSFDEMG